MDDRKIGELIRTIRERLKLTQTELAARSGLTVNFLCQVENGSKNISNKSLDRIAQEFRIPAVFLAMLAEDPKNSEGSNAKLIKLVQDIIVTTTPLLSDESHQ